MAGVPPLQRQVVLVGAGQAHLGVLRLWGLRRMREAAAEKSSSSSAAPAAAGDKTAAALLRHLLSKDAAAQHAPSEEDGSSSSNNRHLPLSAVSLLLVTETTEVLYSAMVPGYIAGEFPLSDLTIDLSPLCSFAGASLIIARAVGLLPNEKLLLLDGRRPPLRFDVLSIDTGSKPELALIAGSLRPLTRSSTFFGIRSSFDGEASTAAARTGEVSPGHEETSPRDSPLSPCGCPTSGKSGGNSSSRYCCCCVCPMRPLSGIVASWLTLRQQLQRAWQQASETRSQATTTADVECSRRDSSSSSSSSSIAALFAGGTFRILIIGGGAVGVEMALALQYAVQQLLQTLEKQQQLMLSTASHLQTDETETIKGASPLKTEVVLATSGQEILTGYPRRAQNLLRKLLNGRGVKVCVNCRVQRVEETGDGRLLISSSGQQLSEPFDFTFCCTSARPQDWIVSTGLPLDEDGYLKVLPTLQCVNFPSIFAAGDTASISGHSRPKAGVYAVRAAPVIESNIWHLLRGEALESWNPQSSFVSLLLTGKREAALCRGPLVFNGQWVWKIKKAIDSSWLANHREFLGRKSSNASEVPSSAFLGFKELGAAAASGAEALSTWVSANLSGLKGLPEAPRSDLLPHPCMGVFVRLLGAAAAEGRPACRRCAGCSGKIPQRVLSAALQQLRYHNAKVQQLHAMEQQLLQKMLDHHQQGDDNDWEANNAPLFSRPEVICGLRSPDDSCLFAAAPLDMKNCSPKNPTPLLAQSIDFFRLFTGDLYTMGRISAAHCLSDLYACGAEPLTALALTVLRKAPPELQSNNLLQILSGATSVLAAEGCELSGGHSAVSEGISAAGFAVTGRIFYPSPAAAAANKAEGAAEKQKQQQQQKDVVVSPLKQPAPGFMLRKGSEGVQPGCVLLLTKGIGTGIIFAAHAKVQAKGAWVEAALQQMQHTNRSAMHALLQHGATACTDVTGFGLAGHLLEMIDASNKALTKAAAAGETPGAAKLIGARIWLDRIPLLPGACELTRKGLTASLFVENAAAAARRLTVSSATADTKAPLVSLHQGNARGLSPSEPQLGDERNLLQVLQEELHGPCCCRIDTPHTGRLAESGSEETDSSSNGSCCCSSTSSNGSLVFPLLFDPQTSGGLLAVVPASAAAACLTALRAHVAAMAIGDIVPLPEDAAGASHVSRSKPVEVLAPETPPASTTNAL